MHSVFCVATNEVGIFPSGPRDVTRGMEIVPWDSFEQSLAMLKWPCELTKRDRLMPWIYQGMVPLLILTPSIEHGTRLFIYIYCIQQFNCLYLTLCVFIIYLTATFWYSQEEEYACVGHSIGQTQDSTAHNSIAEVEDRHAKRGFSFKLK